MFGGLGFMMMIIVISLVMMSLSAGRRSALRGPGPQNQLGGGLYGPTFQPPRGFGPQGFPPQAYGQQSYGARGYTAVPSYDQPYDQSYGWGGQQQQFDAPLAEQTREAVDADITKLGEELRDLDLDVVGIDLTAEAQTDYSTALDSYENAKQALQQATVESDVTAITHILEEGRYAMACVKARAHGKNLPERRPPCFFDPAHGPSVTNVTWSPDGGVAREVPACALDSARVRSGASPHIRMVEGAGMGMVPYWQDRQYAPWARGYYQDWGYDPAIRSLTSGVIMFGGLSLLFGMLDD